MDRRRYLQLVGSGSVVGLSGCLSIFGESTTDGRPNGTTERTRRRVDEDHSEVTNTEAESRETPGYSDVELPISKDELNRGAPKDRIPAITDPAFASDWDSAPVGHSEFGLEDDDRVIGVARGGEARAYPLRVLNWHEIVNDDFDGPLLVSFCPLCGSGLTAEREVRGEPATFGVSGYLYKSDLVMYDDVTDSLWSQIMATAINGEMTGEELTIVPSTLTTWGTWRTDHPETRVLLPPPKSGVISDARPRDYEVDPYRGYDSSEQIGLGFNDVEDDRLHPKAEVIGIATPEAARAYPLDTVVEEEVINDTVGELPVVVAAADRTLVAFDRRLGEETLTFAPGRDHHMTGGGSTWRILTGEAIDGPYRGKRLGQASDATTMFWFAWVDFNPETEIYGE